MNISAATAHLAGILKTHYEQIDSSDPVIDFLKRVGKISYYRDQGDLSKWEQHVLSTEINLDQIELREDFRLIELVWEVGRTNLFGKIQPMDSLQFYEEASALMFKKHQLKTENSKAFDFAMW